MKSLLTVYRRLNQTHHSVIPNESEGTYTIRKVTYTAPGPTTHTHHHVILSAEKELQ
ncbi:MAG: hypothetical protein ACXVB0_09710 [Mucilaginibacter sp.]